MTTPFGTPVLPLVYMIIAVLSALGAVGVAALPPPSASRSSNGTTLRLLLLGAVSSMLPEAPPVMTMAVLSEGTRLATRNTVSRLSASHTMTLASVCERRGRGGAG